MQSLNSLSKKKSSKRKKIYFNRKEKNKFATEYFLSFTFLVTTIFCVFYG